MSQTATPGTTDDLDLSGFQPFGPHTAVAYEYFAKARSTEPVFFSEPLGAWCVTRYEDIRAVAADPVTFSSARAFPKPTGLPDEAQRMVDFQLDNSVLTILDPPAHGPVRRIAHEAFGPRVMEAWENRIRTLVEGQLDRLAGRDRFDLVAEVAEDVPLLGVMRVIGFPEERAGDIKRWLAAALVVITGSAFVSREELAAQGHACVPIIDFAQEVVEARRAAPTDDLISFMVHHEVRGRRLTDLEICSNAVGLLGAGWETTGNAISNTVRGLLDSGQWTDLVEGRLPIADVVAEGLRYDSPIFGLFRTATRDVTVNGASMRAGDNVLLLYAAANHDPEVYEHPERFDVRRARAFPDISFGHGIHYCVGAPLARMEIGFTIEGLAKRFPTLRLESDAPPVYKPLNQFKGPLNLWLRAS
jgi:cytochrome P450